MAAGALLLAGGGLLLLAALWQMRGGETDLTRERIVFGLETPEPEPEEDLTDPYYGIEGLQLFLYRLRDFLSGWRGRLTLLTLGSLLGSGVAYYLERNVYGSVSAGIGTGLTLLLLSLFLLHRSQRKRSRRLRRELPNALEILAALMQGGLGFESALGHLLREADTRHPLYFELRTMYEALRRGRMRSEAFRIFATRCDTLETSDLAVGLVQADLSGGSMADVLHHHAQAIFREVEAEIRQQAERLPVRMFFPMLFTIFPAMFVVLLLPNMLRILDMLTNIMLYAQ